MGCVTDDLVAIAIEADGGQTLWNTLRGLTVDLSVGGPVWAMKGWPPGATFDQTVTLADFAASAGLTRMHFVRLLSPRFDSEDHTKDIDFSPAGIRRRWETGYEMTVRAIEQSLLRDGFVARYATHSAVDGLPPGEGAFLACSFWLADNYALQGRVEEATAMFEQIDEELWK